MHNWQVTAKLTSLYLHFTCINFMYSRRESRIRLKRETSPAISGQTAERERKCERERKRSALGKEGVGSSVSYWTRLASAVPKTAFGSLGNANLYVVTIEEGFFLHGNSYGAKWILQTFWRTYRYSKWFPSSARR